MTVATNNLTTASGQVADFGSQVQDASGKLQTSTSTVNNMFNSLASNLAGLKSGNLQGVGESLMGLDKLFNNSGVTNAVGGALAKGMSKLLGNSAIGKSVAESLGNSGLLGQIISAILSILDILKDGIGALVSSLIDTILNAVSGILENLLNGQMFVQISESLVKGIGGILDAVTWGGFSSWFGSGESDKTLEQDMEYLAESNRNLQKSIDNLAERMNEGSVADAENIYNKQKALLEQSMANTQEQMQRSGAAYSNGFIGIGGSHSSNYKIDKGMSGNDWNRISSIVGRRVDSAGAFFGLSSEEMLKVFNEIPMTSTLRSSRSQMTATRTPPSTWTPILTIAARWRNFKMRSARSLPVCHLTVCAIISKASFLIWNPMPSHLVIILMICSLEQLSRAL